MLRTLNKKAQSTLEYAVLFGVIVAGLIAMQVYMKRGVQGKLQDSADNIGEQYSVTSTSGSTTVRTKSSSREDILSGDAAGNPFSLRTSRKSSSESTQTGSERTGALSDE